MVRLVTQTERWYAEMNAWEEILLGSEPEETANRIALVKTKFPVAWTRDRN